MTDQQDPHTEQYDRAREAFDGLAIEDKTVFLLKETVNTIVQGVEEAARSILDEFEGMFGEAPVEEAETEEKAAEPEEKAAAENGAAKKTSTRKKTTASKASSSTAKKTTAKKTTSTRKTTSSRRKTTKKDDSDAS